MIDIQQAVAVIGKYRFGIEVFERRQRISRKLNLSVMSTNAEMTKVASRTAAENMPACLGRRMIAANEAPIIRNQSCMKKMDGIRKMMSLLTDGPRIKRANGDDGRYGGDDIQDDYRREGRQQLGEQDMASRYRPGKQELDRLVGLLLGDDARAEQHRVHAQHHGEIKDAHGEETADGLAGRAP